MRIKTIGYGKLKTDGNYNNSRAYIEAELSETDDPNKVLTVLKEHVNSILGSGQLADVQQIQF